MGVDTKGCVVTDVKDAFAVNKIICEAICNMITDSCSTQRRIEIIRSGVFKFPRTEICTTSDMLSITFKYKNEDRQLNVHFDCDYDLKNHEEIEGDSCLWLSLGAWGSSEEIMRNVLTALKPLGSVYIDLNDCDDVGYLAS